MQGQRKISISEQKPSKLMVYNDGYEAVSNDGSMKIQLRHTVVMDGSIESGFYYTVIWIKEDNGWIKTNGSKSYKTKEEFISDIRNAEEFTEAVKDYEKSL